jgi:uncharacterized protein YifE (UPF0438 family)
MAKLTRELLLKRVFSDPKNYPYGFSRSGDFSINESQVLGQYGCLVAALVDGHIESVCEEDDGLLDSAFGNKDAQTAVEKAWVKYQKRINRPRPGTIYGSHPLAVDDDPQVDVSIDFEIADDD